jgi:hypothetical protein
MPGPERPRPSPGSQKSTEGNQTGEDTPESARAFFNFAFDKLPELQRWGQRTKNKEEYREIIERMMKLRAKYPGVYEEVYGSRGGDVEDLRRWRNFLSDWDRRLESK